MKPADTHPVTDMHTGLFMRCRPKSKFPASGSQVRAVVLFLVSVMAGPMHAAEAPDWTAIAKDAQPALIAIVSGSGQHLLYDGFFVSKDGHALCSLQAVTRGEIPREVCTSDKKRHPFGSIVAVFPNAELALVKVNYHPDKWLEPSDQPVPLGTEVAVVRVAQVPPIHVGPILARRTVRKLALRGLPFVPILSIGTQPAKGGPRGYPTLGGGSPIVDRQGRLQGVVSGSQTTVGGQVITTASPMAPLSEVIAKAVKESPALGVPLPAALDPYDPVSVDKDCIAATDCARRGDTEQALAHVNSLVKAHPESSAARLLQLDILDQSGRKTEHRALVDELLKPGNGPQFDQISLLELKGRLQIAANELDAAIATYKTLVDLSPKDFPGHQAMLADCYRFKGDDTGDKTAYLEAEKWYKSAIAAEPEHIDVLSAYQKVLDHLQRWRESDAVSAQIDEMERIYRRR